MIKNNPDTLFSSLKQVLKSRGFSYKELAKKIGLSEAAIKRMFSEKSMNLQRLSEICNVLDISFYDLAKLTIEDGDLRDDQLTEEQELELIADRKAASLFYLLLNQWKISDIIREYNFSSTDIERLLIKLDKLKLIEFYSVQKIKLLYSRAVLWNENNKLSALYLKEARQEFLKQVEQTSENEIIFRVGELSKNSVRALNSALEKIKQDFDRLARADVTLKKSETTAIGMYMTLQPAINTMFKSLKRKN
jgi:DNA-binding Xre family transcriptional regulator